MLKKILTSLILSGVCVHMLVFAQNYYEPPFEECVEENCCNFLGGFYTEASFIYWNPSFVNYEIAGLKTQLTPTGDRELIEIQSLDFPYAPGFQFGIGYDLPCQLDLFLNWTWVRSNPHRTATSTADTLVLNLISEGPRLFASEAQAKGFMNLNVLDLELGKTYCLPNCGFFRPFVGLKAAWIDYSFSTKFFNVTQEITTNGTPNVYTNLQNTSKDHIGAIGPRIGCNTQWYLGNRHVSLIVNCACSLLWEHFSPNNISFFELNGAPHGGAEKQHLNGINPVTELFVGLSYSQCLGGLQTRATIGYDVQCWLNQIHDTPINGDESLDINGLTVSLELSF